MTRKARDRGGCGKREVERRISATLIDRYLTPSPLAWKNTRSSMSTKINKRKPPDRSFPPLWFSRGLAVTFPQDKVVTKVTLPTTTLHSPPPQTISLRQKPRVGSGKSRQGNLFSNSPQPSTPPLKGSQGRVTESQQQIDVMTTVSLTFSEMHQGVKRWHVPTRSMQR